MIMRSLAVLVAFAVAFWLIAEFVDAFRLWWTIRKLRRGSEAEWHRAITELSTEILNEPRRRSAKRRDALIGALQLVDRPSVRAAAAYTLIAWRGKEVAQVLAQALSSEKDESVCVAEIQALWRVGGFESVDQVADYPSEAIRKCDRFAPESLRSGLIQVIGEAHRLTELKKREHELKEREQEKNLRDAEELAQSEARPEYQHALNLIRLRRYAEAISLGSVGIDALVACRIGIDAIGHDELDALGSTGDVRAAYIIIGRIPSLSWSISGTPYEVPYAVRALTRLGDRAVDRLCEALRDRSRGVAEVAAESLGAIGSRRAVDSLIAMVRDESIHWGDRQVAVRALGAIGDKRVVGPLVEMLKTRLGGDLSIRYQTGLVLISLGYTAVVDDFIAARDRDAIVNIGLPAAPNLIAALADTNAEIRADAASLLGKIGDRSAIEALKAVLADPDYAVRNNAESAIQKLERQKIRAQYRYDHSDLNAARQHIEDTFQVRLTEYVEGGYISRSLTFFTEEDSCGAAFHVRLCKDLHWDPEFVCLEVLVRPERFEFIDSQLNRSVAGLTLISKKLF